MASAPASATTAAASFGTSVAEAASSTLSQALKAANLTDGSEAKKEDDLEEGEVNDEEAGSVEVEVAEQDDDLNKIKTVFDNPSNFNVKHPLYSAWTLWFESANAKGLAPKAQPANGAAAVGGWMDNVRPVIQFDSVEEFWGLYNNIVPPSQLPPKANYYLFKKDIIPAWEDEANAQGGKWSCQLPKDKTKSRIDEMWMYTMLAAIGETFETPLPNDTSKTAPPPDSNLITGVILSTRPNFYRLVIWTRTSPSPNPEKNEEFINDETFKRIKAVGKHFKTSVLGFNEDASLAGGLATEVEWVNHKDSDKKGKFMRKIIA